MGPLSHIAQLRILPPASRLGQGTNAVSFRSQGRAPRAKVTKTDRLCAWEYCITSHSEPKRTGISTQSLQSSGDQQCLTHRLEHEFGGGSGTGGAGGSRGDGDGNHGDNEGWDSNNIWLLLAFVPEVDASDMAQLLDGSLYKHQSELVDAVSLSDEVSDSDAHNVGADVLDDEEVDGDRHYDDEDEDDEDENDEDEDDEDEVRQVTSQSVGPRKPRNKDNFICESVLATNLPTGPGIPTKSELFQGLNARKGAELSKKDLSDDLEQLLNTGLFANVDANVTPKKDGYAVEFVFREKIWPQVQSFRVSGSTILPKEVEQEVLDAARKNQNCTVRVLATAKNIVEGYYTTKGLTFGTISHFDGMENGEVIAHVVEGEITRVQTVFVDDNLQPVPGNKGVTHPRVIQREHNFKVGNLYNVEDAKTALRDIFLLQLFDNVQVVPRPDERDPSKIQVDILLRERPTKTAETELEWSIAPGENGSPDLVSARPGGSVFFEHRNIDRWGRQLFGSVSTANFLQPQDDLGFKLEYIHPYCRGDSDGDKTSFKAAAFNSRKLSPVFTGGPLMPEVPGVWVDRAGFKATMCQNFSRQSKCSMAAVIEEVTTRDDSGAICTSGAKQLPNGALSLDGPRTTLSDSGTDRVLFLQGNITRDTTKFVNGTQIGARDILQVEQSVPYSLSAPTFHRWKINLTRFIQCMGEDKSGNVPPPVLVLHARSGHTLGNCAAYDAFSLGGPHSCRGYTVGELGAARSFLETAVELRMPVPLIKTHAFAFWESCSDLSSSAKLSGNPTEFYRRAGTGSSYGAGLKLGPVRAEWCVDGNSGAGSTFIRFGERF